MYIYTYIYIYMYVYMYICSRLRAGSNFAGLARNPTVRRSPSSRRGTMIPWSMCQPQIQKMAAYRSPILRLNSAAVVSTTMVK